MVRKGTDPTAGIGEIVKHQRPAIIDLTKDDGGSGTGWSYWSMWLDGCNMRPHLCETTKTPYVASDSALVGRIVHKLLEHHETGKRYRDYILQADGLEPYAVRDAQKIFAQYRANYPPGWWGKVLFKERPLRGTVAGIDFTGRIDLGLQVDRLAASHWVAIGAAVVPGFYVVDYKTYSPPWDPEMYLNSPQFTGYWELMEQTFEKMPKGTLVLGINKKDAKRAPAIGLLIPPPTPEKRIILHHALRVAEAYSRPPYVPNIGRCGRGNYRCPFYLKECNLHTVVKGATNGK
jgi:hypothetical protein